MDFGNEKNPKVVGHDRKQIREDTSKFTSFTE